MASRILILTTEPLPIPGVPATGAGMRAWGLAFGLRSAGFRDVTLAYAADATRGRHVEPSAIPGIKSFERGQLDDFIAAEAPEAIVFQHWGLLREVKSPLRIPVAIDLAGPHLLERRLWGSANPADDIREKLEALAKADFVICSGEFQRHYFIPFLVQAGHDPRASLCPVIPFSLSPELPNANTKRDHTAFLFSGMFLPWQDPEATLRTTVGVLEERERGKLNFIGGPHPSGDVSGGRFDALMDHISASKRVKVHGLMPFEELLALMQQSGVAIDLMPRNAERELAFPTRTVTYMWAGLPVIHNDYDELAEPIRQAKAGWVLDPRDQDGLSKIVGRLLGHREDVEKRAENARKLVQERYTWDKTITPLAEWCRAPKLREGKTAPVVSLAPRNAEESTPTPRKPRPKGQVTYSPRNPVTDTERGPWYLSPIVFALALPVSALLVFLFALIEVARLFVRRAK